MALGPLALATLGRRNSEESPKPRELSTAMRETYKAEIVSQYIGTAEMRSERRMLNDLESVLTGVSDKRLW